MKQPGYLVTGSQPICGSPVLMKLDQAVVNILEAWRSAALKHTQNILACELPERTEWFIEGRAFCGRMIRRHPNPPLRSASFLSFSVFLCVVGRAYWRERGAGRGWTWSRIIQLQESLALYNRSIVYTLWWATDHKILNILTCRSP